MGDRQSVDGSLLECDLPIGRPGLVVHNEIAVTGWAASPARTSGVIVEIEDRIFNATCGLDTPELMEARPDLPGAERAGYELRIDTSGWSPGVRRVALSAYDAGGERTVIEGKLDVRPFREAARAAGECLAALADGRSALWLDEPLVAREPSEIDGPLSLSGWAYLEDGIEAVVVTLDGRIQYDALRPLVRPDLLDDHGARIAADAGFALRLHEADCPAGRHSLSVVALGRRDGAVGIQTEILCRPRPPIDDEARSEAATTIQWSAGASRTPRTSTSADSDGLEDLATAERRMWEDRALLAEADAAFSRTEARLGKLHQEKAQRLLQATEAKLRDARLDQAALERAHRDLAATRARLASTQQEHGAARAEAEKAKSDIESLTKDLEDVRRRLEQQEEQLTGARRELELRGDQLAMAETELQARDEALAHSRAAIRARDDELARTRAELETQAQELASRSAVLERQEASFSWRITRPLRWTKRGWLRMRGRID